MVGWIGEDLLPVIDVLKHNFPSVVPGEPKAPGENRPSSRARLANQQILVIARLYGLKQEYHRTVDRISAEFTQ